MTILAAHEMRLCQSLLDEIDSTSLMFIVSATTIAHFVNFNIF